MFNRRSFVERRNAESRRLVEHLEVVLGRFVRMYKHFAQGRRRNYDLLAPLLQSVDYVLDPGGSIRDGLARGRIFGGWSTRL